MQVINIFKVIFFKKTLYSYFVSNNIPKNSYLPLKVKAYILNFKKKLKIEYNA